MLTIHTGYKLFLSNNKAIDMGVALNDASHSALSIAAQATEEQKQLMSCISFVDAHGVEYPSISRLSLIVLRGSQSDLAKLVTTARQQEILNADFIETMTGGTYVQQLVHTQTNKEHIYYAVALFGKKDP